MTFLEFVLQGSAWAGSVGQGQSYQLQQDHLLGPAFWSQQPNEPLEAQGRVPGKLRGGKEFGNVS